MLARKYRRLLVLVVAALGPLCSACELVFDFDRTPLQPIFEAGSPESDSRSEGGRDSGAEGG